MTLGAALKEFTRYASPRILLAIFPGVLAYRIWLGDYQLLDLYLVLGVIAGWPFLEWVIHVFVLHFKPFEIFGVRIDPWVASKHRRHHRDPWNMPILFIPLHTYIYTIPIHFVGWNLLFDRAQAFTMIVMFFGMTLHYEWVHYMVHSRYKPKSAYYRRLWLNHRLHHCKNEHYWMGVTMLAGDQVLGTAKKKEEVETSPTCRTLGVVETLGAEG